MQFLSVCVLTLKHATEIVVLILFIHLFFPVTCNRISLSLVLSYYKICFICVPVSYVLLFNGVSNLNWGLYMLLINFSRTHIFPHPLPNGMIWHFRFFWNVEHGLHYLMCISEFKRQGDWIGIVWKIRKIFQEKTNWSWTLKEERADFLKSE